MSVCLVGHGNRFHNFPLSNISLKVIPNSSGEGYLYPLPPFPPASPLHFLFLHLDSCGYYGGAGSGGRVAFIASSYGGSLSVFACGASGQGGYPSGEVDKCLPALCYTTCVFIGGFLGVCPLVVVRWPRNGVLERWLDSNLQNVEHSKLWKRWWPTGHACRP